MAQYKWVVIVRRSKVNKLKYLFYIGNAHQNVRNLMILHRFVCYLIIRP